MKSLNEVRADAIKESQAEPLTDEEAAECFRAFKEIEDAYSNLQFETMQELFCCMSLSDLTTICLRASLWRESSHVHT